MPHLAPCSVISSLLPSLQCIYRYYYFHIENLRVWKQAFNVHWSHTVTIFVGYYLIMVVIIILTELTDWNVAYCSSAKVSIDWSFRSSYLQLKYVTEVADQIKCILNIVTSHSYSQPDKSNLPRLWLKKTDWLTEAEINSSSFCDIEIDRTFYLCFSVTCFLKIWSRLVRNFYTWHPVR